MLCDHVHRRVLQLVSLLGWTGAAVLNFQVSDLLTTSPSHPHSWWADCLAFGLIRAAELVGESKRVSSQAAMH